MLTVSTWMTRRLFTLGPEASLADAMELTRTHRIRHVPILSNDRLVGIISDRDLKRAVPNALCEITKEKFEATVAGTKLRQIMKSDVVTVKPDTPIIHAVEQMLQLRIGCLPVVEDDRQVG
ncbi:MAG: CBS domain-containing protein, partial [Planctomycetota bacterium]|nr:CBS domain-containing protein [Planctomycetota bacterium]